MSFSDPWYDAEIVTPANTNLAKQCTGLYVWTAGDLKFKTAAGTVVGPYAVVAGQVVPFQVSQVMTGTTAVVSAGYGR